MIIKVEQKHINFGLKRACKNCPVALALVETLQPKLKGTVKVAVGYLLLSIYHEDKHIEVPTIHKVNSFMTDFDNSRPVSPFEFEVQDNIIERLS